MNSLHISFELPNSCNLETLLRVLREANCGVRTVTCSQNNSTLTIQIADPIESVSKRGMRDILDVYATIQAAPVPKQGSLKTLDELTDEELNDVEDLSDDDSFGLFARHPDTETILNYEAIADKPCDQYPEAVVSVEDEWHNLPRSARLAVLCVTPVQGSSRRSVVATHSTGLSESAINHGVRIALEQGFLAETNYRLFRTVRASTLRLPVFEDHKLLQEDDVRQIGSGARDPMQHVSTVLLRRALEKSKDTTMTFDDAVSLYENYAFAPATLRSVISKMERCEVLKVVRNKGRMQEMSLV